MTLCCSFCLRPQSASVQPGPCRRRLKPCSMCFMLIVPSKSLVCLLSCAWCDKIWYHLLRVLAGLYTKSDACRYRQTYSPLHESALSVGRRARPDTADEDVRDGIAIEELNVRFELTSSYITNASVKRNF